MSVDGRFRSFVLALALMVAAAVLVGCGGSSSGGGSSTGGADAGGGSGAVKLDGATLLAQRCTYCHNTERIDAATKDKAGWEATIDKMVAKGAQVTDAEKPVIAEYLANR